MKTPSSISNFNWLIKETLKGLSIVLLVFLFIVALKSILSSTFSPTSYGLGGLLKEKELDILFVGSSHTRQSYDVALIEKRCNCKAYALAYSGMDPHMMDVILRYIQERTSIKIKKIIVEAYAFKIVSEPSFSDSRIYSEAPIGLKYEIIKSISRNVKGMDAYDLFNLIVNENNESLLTSPVSNPILARVSYRGGYRNKKTNLLDAEKFSKLTEIVKEKVSYRENAVQISAIASIASMFPPDTLVFIDPPMPFPVSNNNVTLKAAARFKSIVTNAGHPYIAPWENSELTKIPQHFEDWNHLSHIGRGLYSEDVVKILATNLNKKNR